MEEAFNKWFTLRHGAMTEYSAEFINRHREAFKGGWLAQSPELDTERIDAMETGKWEVARGDVEVRVLGYARTIHDERIFTVLGRAYSVRGALDEAMK